jgi:hypothetical protein
VCVCVCVCALYVRGRVCVPTRRRCMLALTAAKVVGVSLSHILCACVCDGVGCSFLLKTLAKLIIDAPELEEWLTAPYVYVSACVYMSGSLSLCVYVCVEGGGLESVHAYVSGWAALSVAVLVCAFDSPLTMHPGRAPMFTCVCLCVCVYVCLCAWWAYSLARWRRRWTAGWAPKHSSATVAFPTVPTQTTTLGATWPP